MLEMSKKMDLRETKDPKGLNALHFAANKGSLEICKFLVEEVGVDVNSVSSVGKISAPVTGGVAYIISQY